MKILPKISVVTICCNAEDQIEKTIESVVSQDYPAIEYIIIDGASTDQTLDKIKKYLSKINVFISEPDQGLYDAMNKGLRSASGVYILFMNAGDTFYESQSLSNLIQNAKDADFIYGKTVVTGEDGTQKEWHKKIPCATAISPASFLQGMVVCHQAMLIRKTLVSEFDLKWEISSDLDWVIKALKKTEKKHFYDQYVCTFLMGGLSSRRKWKAITERFWISVKHFGFSRAVFAQFQIIISWFR